MFINLFFKKLILSLWGYIGVSWHFQTELWGLIIFSVAWWVFFRVIPPDELQQKLNECSMNLIFRQD